MATKKSEKSVSAVITEKNASNNPHLDRVVNAVTDGYRATRRVGQTLSLRKHRTAMIPNEKPIWVLVKGADGKVVGSKLLFGAGWYLSAEEQVMKEELMKDEESRSFNERMWSAMEAQGIDPEKVPGSPHEVRVVSGTE